MWRPFLMQKPESNKDSGLKWFSGCVPLFLELGHEHDNERTYESQEHGSDNDPCNHLFSDILSGSAAHLFTPL